MFIPLKHPVDTVLTSTEFRMTDDVKTGGRKEELCCKLARVFGKFRLETTSSHKGDGKGDTENDMQMEGRKNGPISLEVFGFRKKKTSEFLSKSKC